MGILKRLFGKKKKEEEIVKPKAAPQEESQDVSLDDVEKGLKNVETVKEDKSVEQEKPEYKTESEPVPKTEKEESIQEKPKPEEAPKKEEKPASVDKPSDGEEVKHYHIKKHAKGWQVIEEDSKKAYRVFQYQKEAIDFAKSENLSYTIFKADGTPRTE